MLVLFLCCLRFPNVSADFHHRRVDVDDEQFRVFRFAEDGFACRVEVLKLSVGRSQNTLEQKMIFVYGGFGRLIIIVFGETSAHSVGGILAEKIRRRSGNRFARADFLIMCIEERRTNHIETAGAFDGGRVPQRNL